jgi:hypothetical protein
MAPPGGRYRITTRLDQPDDPGPLLMVFELSSPGDTGGVTRVRVVQSGFGRRADWDDLFVSGARSGPHAWSVAGAVGAHAPPRNGPPRIGTAVRGLGIGARQTGDRWPGVHRLGAERAEPVRVRRGLVYALEDACARLQAIHWSLSGRSLEADGRR